MDEALRTFVDRIGDFTVQTPSDVSPHGPGGGMSLCSDPVGFDPGANRWGESVEMIRR